MRTRLGFILLLCVCGSLYAGPQEVVRDMSPGWALGNALDSIPVETNSNPTTQEYVFSDIKKAGFKSVRIPVTWDNHLLSSNSIPPEVYKSGAGWSLYLSSPTNSIVDPAWMNRVEQVVDWALKQNLYVVLEVHHDSWMVVGRKRKAANGKPTHSYEQNIVKFEKLWRQIAERFKNKSDKLIFEILNEPQFEEENLEVAVAQLTDLNDRILKVIRSSGGGNERRLVILTGLNGNSDMLVKHFTAPNDPNILLTFHYYSPWNFIVNWWGVRNWGSEADKAGVSNAFSAVREKFSGTPLILGEYGCGRKTDRLQRYRYHDFIVRTAYSHGITSYWWDNGERYDRTNRTWADETDKEIIVSAGLGITNSFVSPLDNYFKAGVQPADLPLTVDLNGNALVGIYNGADKLAESADYLSGNPVIIKKEYLAKLLNSTNLGVVATLSFHFTAGANMPARIIRHSPPALPSEITIDRKTAWDMYIPVSFKGNVMAAATLVDSQGKPVKYSWTPYLRFYEDFEDYKETLILRRPLLDSVKTDCVMTFEFWSGDTATVKIH